MLSVLFACAQLSANTAMTFTVETTADNGDNLNPLPGSLRAAILQSNANEGSFSNTIIFAVDGTITPISALPAIEQTVLIDGYTAPGAYPNSNGLFDPAGNNASIAIEIRGPGTGTIIEPIFPPLLMPFSGLSVTGTQAAGTVIQGLCINNFAQEFWYVDLYSENVGNCGIQIYSDDVVVAGCFIGTRTDGVTAAPNSSYGIFIGANNVAIGGTTNAARNLLLGCTTNYASTTGVVTVDGAAETIIIGNTIGVDRSGGSVPFTGTNVGISYFGGGDLTITNNVISGHTAANIFLNNNLACFGTQTITDNYIGTDVTGSYSVSYNGAGIVLNTYYPPFDSPCYLTNFIVSDNVISGNTSAIVVGAPATTRGAEVTGAQITSNFIGTDASGSYAIPNSLDAIYLARGINTFIGSNIISGNGGSGIVTGKAKGTIIKSNFIGVNANEDALGNGRNGIQLGVNVAVGVPSFGDIVGGAISYGDFGIEANYDEGNIIAFNGGYGIQLVSYTEEETIQGNIIYGNELDGIRLGPKSSNNWIGGFRTKGNFLLTGELQSQGYVNLGPLGTSNQIEGNAGYGISAYSSDGNKIQTNIIIDNGKDGITLVNSSDNLIGGKVALANPAVETPPVMGNVITGNGGFGISIVANKGVAKNNTILSNEIADNDDSAIQYI